jgi:hypothetical protein
MLRAEGLLSRFYTARVTSRQSGRPAVATAAEDEAAETARKPTYTALTAEVREKAARRAPDHQV